MTWSWRLEDADGSLVIGPASPTHPNQADAESWIGEQWRELSDSGVAQVLLMDGSKVVYGPMALSE
jgi:hypothetical protein